MRKADGIVDDELTRRETELQEIETLDRRRRWWWWGRTEEVGPTESGRSSSSSWEYDGDDESQAIPLLPNGGTSIHFSFSTPPNGKMLGPVWMLDLRRENKKTPSFRKKQVKVSYNNYQIFSQKSQFQTF